MSLTVEEVEALDPVDAAFFRADGVVFPADDFAHLVEEFPGAFLWRLAHRV
jgi:hypothetical protein